MRITGAAFALILLATTLSGQQNQPASYRFPITNSETTPAGQLATPGEYVVQVRVEDPAEPFGFIGTGTGFIIRQDEEFYYILTNYHIVEPIIKEYRPVGRDSVIADTAPKIVTIYYRSMRPTTVAEILGYDELLDVALLRTPIDKQYPSLPALPIGSSVAMNIGDPVTIIGHPAGLYDSVLPAAISAARRQTGLYGYKLQLNIAVAPGTSGSPVINSKGEMIGIVNSNYALYYEAPFVYAMVIPADHITAILGRLERGEHIKHVGLEITTFPAIKLPPHIKDRYGIPRDLHGAAVMGVRQNSLTMRSDVRPVDIITHVDSVAIEDFIDAFDMLLFNYHPGDSVTLTIWRRGRIINRTVPLTTLSIRYY